MYGRLIGFLVFICLGGTLFGEEGAPSVGADASSADSSQGAGDPNPGDAAYCANGAADIQQCGTSSKSNPEPTDDRDPGASGEDDPVAKGSEYCPPTPTSPSPNSPETSDQTAYNCIAGSHIETQGCLVAGVPDGGGGGEGGGAGGGCGGGCGFTGDASGGGADMPSPVGGIGVLKALPTFSVIRWSRGNTGAYPFGDHTHNYHVPMTQSYDAVSGVATFQLRLPEGGVRPTFTSTDGVTFTAALDRGLSHGSSMAVESSEFVIHGPRGHVWRYAIPSGWDFTDNGRIMNVAVIAFPTAYPITLSYDSNGELTSAASLLATQTYTWGTVNGFRLVTGVTGADGRSLTFTYGTFWSKPELRSMTHPDGSVSTFELDETAQSLDGYTVTYRKRTVTTPNFAIGTGRKRTYWVDTIGRVALVEDGLNRDRYWRPANNVIGAYMWRLIQRPDGSLFLPVFNGSAGAVAEVEYGRDAIDRLTLDSTKRTTARLDELGRITSYQWEGATQYPSRIDYPDSTFETWTRQAGTGQWLSHTDRLGRVSTWERNAAGLATARIYPDETPGNALDNPRETFAYNDAAQLIRKEDELGRVTNYFYTTSGQPEDATATWNDAANHGYLVRIDRPGDAPASVLSVTYRWDAVHHDCIEGLDAASRLFTWTYDTLHRHIRTDWSDTSYASVTYGNPTSADAGLLLSSRDRNGNVTDYEYDVSGKRTAVIRPDDTRIETEYDVHGRVAAVVDTGERTEYVYDSSGRRSSVSHQANTGAALTSSTIYDSRNRVVAQTDPYGRTMGTTYDINNHPVKRIQSRVPDALSWTASQTDVDARLADTTWASVDIGSVGLAGSTAFSGSDVILTAAGTGARATNDSFRFYSQAFPGEGSITVYVDPASTGRSGLMIRDGNNASEPFMEIIVDSTASQIQMHHRYLPGQNSPWWHSTPSSLARWLRLTRTSHVIVAWTSVDGTTWSQIGMTPTPMGIDTRIGLCHSSGSTSTLTSATFSDLTINKTNALSSVRTQAWAEYLDALPRLSGSNPDYTIEEMAFDAEGQLLARIDGRGIRSTFTYDVRGRLVEQIEADATVDGSGVATLLMPPEAARTVFSYDDANNRTAVVLPRSFARDVGGAWSAGSEGEFRTTMTYTERNLRETMIEADGLDAASQVRAERATTAWTYSLTGKVKTTTDPRLNTTTNTYGVCCDRLVKVTDPSGAETIIGYDHYGNRTSVTDPNGNVTLTTFDARHRVSSVTNGENETTTYTYDDDLTDGVGLDATYASQVTGLGFGSGSNGSAVAMTNPASETTLSIHDGLGRTVRSVDPLTHATTITYDTVVSGLVETSQSDALSHITATRTDGAGLTRTMIDALSQSSTAAYDANGNRVQSRDPNGVGLDCVFDARNRDTTCTDTAGAVSGKVFDVHGNLITQTDALLNDTVCTYDARDRKVTCTDRISATTTFTYDLASNLLTITDAQSGVTEYAYDSRNLLIGELFPTGQAGRTQRAYAYDAGRRLIEREVSTVPASGFVETTEYAYDDANRLLTRSYDDSLNDTFTYDPASRLLTAVSARYGSTVTRAYDAASRLTSEALDLANGALSGTTVSAATYTVGYDYDADNRLTDITYPTGSVVERSYTDRNQLDTVTLNAVQIADRAYDNAGRLTTTVLGNGLTESRGYIANDNLIATIAVPGVTSFTYTYDANKRKLSETDGIIAANTQTFSYDDQDRLTAWTRPSAPGGDSQSWSLSAVGDWISTTRNSVVENRTHTAVHEVTGINSNPLSYDEKGNLSGDDRGVTYAWDPENRLATAIIPSSASPTFFAANATYQYDALGRRIAKTVNGQTTVYLCGGAQVLVEIDRKAIPSQAQLNGSESDGTVANASLPVASGGVLPGTGVIRINFQPATATIPAGYYADKGSVYGVRTNGMSYGWALTATSDVVARNGAVPVPELDTLALMDPTFSGTTPPANVWEVALPNGSYPVIVVAGDPLHRNQTNDLQIENQSVTDPDPSSSQTYEQGDYDGYAVIATVADGKLSISQRGGGINAKLCFVEIGPEGTTIDSATLTRLADLMQQATDHTALTPGATTGSREYVYGSYVDEVLSYVQGATRYYVHANHLYSPAAITDSSGIVAERMTYDAYGKQAITSATGTARSQSAIGFDRGFTGYILDQETGMYYARARMYSAGLGRFIGRDPLVYVDSFGLYGANMVPNKLDFSGMETCEERYERDLNDCRENARREKEAAQNNPPSSPGDNNFNQYQGIYTNDDSFFEKAVTGGESCQEWARRRKEDCQKVEAKASQVASLLCDPCKGHRYWEVNNYESLEDCIDKEFRAYAFTSSKFPLGRAISGIPLDAATISNLTLVRLPKSPDTMPIPVELKYALLDYDFFYHLTLLHVIGVKCMECKK